MRAAAHDAGRTPDAASRPTPASAPGIGRGLTTAVVLSGVLNPFNTSALAAALVTIGDDLHADAGFAVFGVLFLVCGALLALTSRRAPARATP
ncbi:hypothetical protein [Micrococcus sp.]|uniref:hypothetical protein n=1 Tax=Micrococcus sp. TaxID=1271 RepID=UPI0026DB185A|nr:hypothetical protein [Micrococcus sp.]MDO4240199.1 hypothetical protein [Micrococcus sp.]